MNFKKEFMAIKDAVKLLDMLKDAKSKEIAIDQEIRQHFNKCYKKHTAGQTPEKHHNPHTLKRIKKLMDEGKWKG